MKIRSYFVLLIVSTSGVIQGSCERSDSSLAVETYIEQLKSNQYVSVDLPDFTYADIPALLEYRNEKQIITNFPRNPISSLWEPECRLGIYVLWTIESIRAVAIGSKYLILKFPSRNPILSLRESDELVLVRTQEAQDQAAQAYYDWFYTNLMWDQFKWRDPLEGINFKWH